MNNLIKTSLNLIIFSLLIAYPLCASNTERERTASPSTLAGRPNEEHAQAAHIPLESDLRHEQEVNFSLGKFKLGYEFQEASGLCSWALHDYIVQKKPLFSLGIKSSKQKLWDIVLDTSDIEFVTVPFAYDKRHLLEECINSVLFALNVLQILFESNSQVSFSDWTSKLEQFLEKLPYGIFYNAAYYPLVDQDGKNLIPPSSAEWVPRFSPQATIQHRLECTIPLYFGLFGFKSRDMPYFSDAFPLRELFLQTLKSANSVKFEKFLSGEQQKINGLVFLHALTLVRMAVNPETTDRDHLQETYQFLERTHQVDPKVKFNLMSRRPFSSMLRDMRLDSSKYENYFNSVILETPNVGIANIGFSQVPTTFSKTNYAEQFFDTATGQEIDLTSNVLPLLQTSFVQENSPILTYLLKRGVVSTTMLRNFKEEIPVWNADGLQTFIPSVAGLFKGDNYFKLAVLSVQNPKFTCTLNLNPLQIRAIPSKYDILSPPCFLDSNNSMGRFKDDLTPEEKEFGEAIVEIRGISGVQPWFLGQCGLDHDLQGEFLQIPFLDNSWKKVYQEDIDWGSYMNIDSSFRQQALGLFDFLGRFGTDPRHVKEVFYMGIPTGLK